MDTSYTGKTRTPRPGALLLRELPVDFLLVLGLYMKLPEGGAVTPPPDEVSCDVRLQDGVSPLKDPGLRDSSSLTRAAICAELPDFFKRFEGHKKSFFFTFDGDEMCGQLLRTKTRRHFTCYSHLHT